MLALALSPSSSSSNSTSLSSHSSTTSLSSDFNRTYDPPSSPAMSSTSGSASSSKLSLSAMDEENETITANHSMPKKQGKQRSQDDQDLRLLAVSTHMTELSYTISDIQTRIFEIQELRHKSQSTGDTAGTTSIIDQSLMSLDERLESVDQGIKFIAAALESLRLSTQTPTQRESNSRGGDDNEVAAMLRKHAALVAEWEAVQDESDVLREELKEDKWLTVFRTVTDQADGMMSSLEKAVNRCQEFIWQVHKRAPDESLAYSQTSLSSLSGSQRSEKSPLNLEVFNSLLDSFEAKKKHYMPATSKVLSIIDKGVQDRVTKNGETLRRHAESAQRWKTLRERITRTDAEMETLRKMLVNGDSAPSENGSSTSGTHASTSLRNGYLATPPSNPRSSRAPSSASTLSRSISPFRKFARKITRSTRPAAAAPPVTPLVVNKNRQPSSEPVHTLRRQKTSIFNFRGSQPPTPVTPDRPSHKYTQSLTPESSPRAQREEPIAATMKRSGKQRWNSSTKVEPEERIATVRATPPRRAPSAAGGTYRQSSDNSVPSVSGVTDSPYKRSLSRSSMASSRPWSPVTSSISMSTSMSSAHPPMPTFRPPSRAQTPSRGVNPGLATATTPRPRPKTPSHIPAPAQWRSISGQQSDGGWDDDEGATTLMQRFSPSRSMSEASPGGHPPRPPSRSMIPVPSLHLSSASRPGSAMSMSQYGSESPTGVMFRSAAARAQTPEHAMRARAQQVPFYQGQGTGGKGRPVMPGKGVAPPPSSFRDGTSSKAPSRPGSRNGAYTPTEGLVQHAVQEYVPGNLKDPLDVEVAQIVNSVAHGLLIERVDPPLRTVPREGEEIRAQYAFSNALQRKVVTCRLTTMSRAGRGGAGHETTKKVMCRIGGGWQDLQLYMLNRQAGM